MNVSLSSTEPDRYSSSIFLFRLEYECFYVALMCLMANLIVTIMKCHVEILDVSYIFSLHLY